MNKNKKNISIVFVTLLILIVSFLYLNSNKKDSTLPDLLKNNSKTENFLESPTTKEVLKTEELSQIVPKALSTDNISVSLEVLDKKYEIDVKEGESVFELMKTLKDKNSNSEEFSFKYKEVSGLGSFITEINGIKGTPGKYWIYYVNDKLASVGVSKYIIKEGDIISWKNEGI